MRERKNCFLKTGDQQRREKNRDNLEDIKKILNFIVEIENRDSKNRTKEKKQSISSWYKKATEEMKERILSGEYPVDVINKLAREFSMITDKSYDSFAFARDALDRRAWELGLRYTDDSVYSKVKFHSGKITKKVTETLKKSGSHNTRDQEKINK